MAEEKPECSMAKEIIICMLFVLSITKVKLTTLVSTYILCMFKHQCFRTFSAHFLSCRPLDILSQEGSKKDELESQTFAMLQNLLLSTRKPTLRFQTMDSRPSMINPFPREEGEIALVN